MESLLHNSANVVAPTLPRLQIGSGFFGNQSSFLKFPQENSSLGRRTLLVVEAKKNKNNDDKQDAHSFIPKPDETTGFFPEAVLLKEKKVQEDGKILPEFADDEEQELYESLNLQLQSALNVERMRHYEVVYLIHEKHAEEVESVNEKVQDFLREKKGRVWRLNDWGLRSLAYKIKKANSAHYMLMNFELEAKWINDFKTMLDQDERVIRHLVMKRDEAITEDCPPPPEWDTIRAGGGPPPKGAKKANLGPWTRDVITQFAYQEVGHLKAIKKTVKGFPRPQLDLSPSVFAKVIDHAFNKTLKPPFDPYANSVNFLIASYLIPYVGLTGYVGANPKLENAASKRLVAGLLGVESGQDAIIRGLLYDRAVDKVKPYGITVAEFTNHISHLRNRLGHAGWKDEGLIVPKFRGAEERIRGNVLAGDEFSMAYDRTPEEILRIVYGTGNETVPGGFFPKGAKGEIAKSHLNRGHRHK
ncbi:Ribosomal protein S6 [Corchorus olitorius]|uniref:Ribosomal protein S6 n=1 Tax=Corchorus olitorius TaxID=93759 RepID=A0A1R3GK95_9ROSI|nr:Ribosomal protein S6 [Corchorus olitorius]